MIVINSNIKPVRAKDWHAAWDNLRKRRRPYGAYMVTFQGTTYSGNYFQMREFCKHADLFGVQRAHAMLYAAQGGLKLVVNQ